MNQLTDTLGIDLPVLQSGMGGVAGPPLVAAVADAGGLGTLAALRLTPDQIRNAIGKIRGTTARPFAMNLWLHDELAPPTSPASLASEELVAVQAVLNDVRGDLGLDPVTDAPPATPDLVADALDVMLQERVPVFCAAIGLADGALVERCHTVGTKVVNMVASVEDALQALDNGVDVLVAQGSEAGGHRSYGSKRPEAEAAGTGTMALVPAIVDAVGSRVPVAAAGGIADGRGFAAALMLGAQGVLLGSRFVATQESSANDVWKRSLLAQQTPTAMTDAFTGQWAKVLPSGFASRYRDSEAPTLPSLMQLSAAADIFEAGRQRGDADHQPLYAGDSAPLIHDLPSAGGVVSRIVAEAETLLGRPLRS